MGMSANDLWAVLSSGISGERDQVGGTVVPCTSSAVQQVFEAIGLVRTRATAMPLSTTRGTHRT
jgi:hypothetical protein